MGTNWQDLPRVKKGNIGESLVNKYLVAHGYIPYSPDVGGSHPFDRIVVAKNKKRIFIAESKTKPARKYYPDTGIELKHYEEYCFIEHKHNLDVFLFFVDEDAGKIYGNWLKKLSASVDVIHNGRMLTYPITVNGIIFFPLVSMIQIADIPSSETEAIKGLSSRKDCYRP